MANLRRYNWESRRTFSSVARVEQPDDDTLVYYLRQDQIYSTTPGWERVTINRRNGEVINEVLEQAPNGEEAVSSRSTFTRDGDNVQGQNEVFACLDKTLTVEQFKSTVASLYKAVKFDQFEKE